jgi:hypothetical protein
MMLLESLDILGHRILRRPAAARPRMTEQRHAGGNAKYRGLVMGCAAALTTTRPMQTATSGEISFREI